MSTGTVPKTIDVLCKTRKSIGMFKSVPFMLFNGFYEGLGATYAPKP